MSTLRSWFKRVGGIFARKSAERRFEAEVQQHIDLLTQRFVHQGLSPREATRAARRQFGNVTLHQQLQREARTFLLLSEWGGDFRYAFRMLRKHRGSNAVIVIALALGIGINAAVFTFVNELLLRPPQQIEDSSGMLEIWLHNHTASGLNGYLPFNYPDYVYYRDHAQSLSGVLAFDGDGQSVIWNRSGEGREISGQVVSGNFFSVLGVPAALGRALSPSDDQPGNPRSVVVLSHTFWLQKMGADPAIIGRELMLNGGSFTVVGVAPPGFTGVIVAPEPDFWAPLGLQEQFTRDKNRLTDRQSSWLIVAGRKKPGMSNTAILAELQLLAHQLELAHPESNKDLTSVIYPLTLMPGPIRSYVEAFTGLLMAVFGLVLLIACVNAASLLLARSTSRTREMAIRSALGAGRGRLVRQTLVESILLSTLAGLTGLGLAWWLSHLLLRLKPASLPITLQVPLDWRVLLFTLFVSLATGVAFGILPALRGAQVNIAPTLKDEAQSADLRKSRVRNLLLIAEIATCVVLTACAALCVRSLQHANSIDPGFSTRNIGLATLDPRTLGYSDSKTQAFYTELMDRVRALPGVTAAAYVNHLPLGTSHEASTLSKHAGKDRDSMRDSVMVDVFRVGPGFFSTMGISLLRGRDLTQHESDDPSAGVFIIINEALAQKLWPGEDPIGKRITLSGEKTTAEVIGLVRTGKYRTLGEQPLPAIFRGELPTLRTLVVRTSVDTPSTLEAVQQQLRTIDPVMVATEVQTIQQYMTFPLFAARTTGLLLGASGILAVTLTAIGLFGVIAYVVSQRTREIGVRMALGARRGDVLKLVMRQGLSVTAIGIVLGLAAACAAARLLSPLLYGIGANDPATLAGVAIGLTVVAMLACYIPARRATRVDPTIALRYE